MILGDGKPKPHGTWDYYGQGDPIRNTSGSLWGVTFSVGVFQWWNKRWNKRSSGTKKLPSIKRIRGYTSHPEEVYQKALALIAEKEGEENGG